MTIMKKISILCIVALASLFGVMNAAFAADLVAVYQQALKSDPTFKAANAAWFAARENLPITRASLLPQLSATGSVNRVYNNVEGGSRSLFTGDDTHKFYNNAAAYSLSLTQPIFNFSSWTALWGAKAFVKQAEANFASAAQDLMLRVASSYFAVLQAQDVLRYTVEQKKAVGEQLRQQKQRFEVGLLPITDVNDAQASYDAIVAQEISAQNDLYNQQEKLQEITGIKYAALNVLRTNLPLISPEPENMEQWVNAAEKQNYSLLAARYAAISARENVSTQEGGHFPTLNATGEIGYNYTSDSGAGALSRDRAASVGLAVNVPIFSGGKVSALTMQAGYQYQQAIADQEKSHRSVVSNTRQAYLGVISGISKIKADRQEVKSKASALESSQNAYEAGLRTMVDVLQAQSALYDAEKTYAKDQYTYLLQTLTLKQQAGTLSAPDLAKINQWLELPKVKANKKNSKGKDLKNS